MTEKTKSQRFSLASFFHADDSKVGNIKRLVIYLVLSFGLTFLWFALTHPKGETWDGMGNPMQNFVTLGMLFPVIAHVLTRLLTGEGFAMTGKDSMMLGISLKNGKWVYFILAMLLPWVYLELGNVISLLLCKEIYDPEYYLTLDIDRKMLYLFPINAIVSGVIASFAAFGEEGGWRGYMMPKLTNIMGRGKALIVGGIIWGLWHAPLTCIGHNFGTDYPGFPYVGIIRMCVCCILMGILLTFVTERSGSVWPAAILHAVNNASPCILMEFMNPDKSPSVLGIDAIELGRFISTALCAAVILVLWKKQDQQK